MAALVLTALSISPVFKDVDQSKLIKYREIIWFIASSRQNPSHKLLCLLTLACVLTTWIFRISDLIALNSTMSFLVTTCFIESFSVEDTCFGFPPTPDSGSEMASFPSPGNSPVHSSFPVHPNDSNFFINGPPSPVDEGIGVDFQRQDKSRKRKVRNTTPG